MNYTGEFIKESIEILQTIDQSRIQEMAETLRRVKFRGGRIFFCGSGGGAGHSSHAACDFRKLAGIESYSVSDNVSELTARINDESWAESYSNWLKVSRINSKDAIFVFSVGGGDELRDISTNLVNAVKIAKSVNAAVLGIAGRDGGYLARNGDAVLVIPNPIASNTTTQTEGFQALFWHLLACHPLLESATPMWESVS